MDKIAYRSEIKTIYATFLLPDGKVPTTVENATIEIRFWDGSTTSPTLQTIVAETPMTLAESPNKYVYVWTIASGATYGTYIAHTSADVTNEYDMTSEVHGAEEYQVISSGGGAGGGFNFIDIIEIV